MKAGTGEADPFVQLNLSGNKRRDQRGCLEVLYEGNNVALKQTRSLQNVFRGMHRQVSPYEQIKIFRLLQGKIIDFIVDPDEEQPILHYREVVPQDGWIMLDARFAHGFYSLEDTIFEYFCVGGYSEANEQAFSITHILTKDFGLPAPILSAKDADSSPLDVRLVSPTLR